MKNHPLEALCTLLLLSGASVHGQAPSPPTHAGLVNASIDSAGALTITPSQTSSRQDFDFLVDRWRIQDRRLDDPLNDSSSWIESEGTSHAKGIIDGLGYIASTRTVVDGEPREQVTLTLFDPATRLWSIYRASGETGTLDRRRPLVGSFEEDIGTFYSQQTLHGEPVLVRLRWDKTDPDRTIRRRAFSRDDGKTWVETESTRAERVVDGEKALREKLLSIDTALPIPEIELDENGDLVLRASASSSRHDFDLLFGNWRMYHRKLEERLSGSTKWIPLESTDTNYGPMLNGLGNTDMYVATFDGEHFEGFTLRLFDPATRLWSLYWVASDSGVLDPPVVGSFEGDVGHFFGKDTFKGQEVIVVFRWDFRDKAHPVWSQAFSPDQGKTWEWNWINVSYRIE